MDLPVRDLVIGAAGSILAMLLIWIFDRAKGKFRSFNSKLEDLHQKEIVLLEKLPRECRFPFVEGRKISLFKDFSEFIILSLLALYIYNLANDTYAQDVASGSIGALIGQAIWIFLKVRRIEELTHRWVLRELSEKKQNDQPNE